MSPEVVVSGDGARALGRGPGGVARGCGLAAVAALGALAMLLGGCDPIQLVVQGSTPDQDGGLARVDARVPTCSDGVKNGFETGVDCGGGVCPACGDRRPCTTDGDCASGSCSQGLCVSCSDGVKDGLETDVDCGGAECNGCPLDFACLRNSDCLDNYCAPSVDLCKPADSGLMFVRPLTYLVGGPGTMVEGLAFGDFDGDHKRDVAALDVGQGRVLLLYGRGDGTLGAPLPVALGPDAHGIASGDLDGDGIDDLATGSGAADKIRLVMSKKGQVTLTASRAPRALAVADFDGDGVRDVALASLGAARVGVFRGQGGGAFDALVDSDLAVPGEQIAVGDLDGDGRADLVVNGFYGPTQVLFGARDLQLPLTYVYSFPDGLGNKYAYTAVGIGRFDDGPRADVVTTQVGGAVQVLLGDGNGGFTPPSLRVATKLHPESLAVADFNRDGMDDLAIACDTSQVVQVLTANGAGSFFPIYEAPTTSGVGAVLATDLNGDGKPDIVAAVGTDRVMVVLQK